MFRVNNCCLGNHLLTASRLYKVATQYWRLRGDKISVGRVLPPLGSRPYPIQYFHQIITNGAREHNSDFRCVRPHQNKVPPPKNHFVSKKILGTPRGVLFFCEEKIAPLPWRTPRGVVLSADSFCAPRGVMCNGMCSAAGIAVAPLVLLLLLCCCCCSCCCCCCLTHVLTEVVAWHQVTLSTLFTRKQARDTTKIAR